MMPRVAFTAAALLAAAALPLSQALVPQATVPRWLGPSPAFLQTPEALEGIHGFLSRSPLDLVSKGIAGLEEPQGNATAPVRHRVEHIQLLNRDRFWWLMGSLILCLTVAVLTLEVRFSAALSSSLSPSPESLPTRAPDTRVLRTRSVVHLEDLTGGRKAGSLGHLAFCFLSLNICMLFWGIAQEFVMTSTYGANEVSVPSVLLLVLCNRFTTTLFTGGLLWLRGEKLLFDGLLMCSAPAASNAMASWCQYMSLRFVSFALQTTAKSAKLLPVLMMSSLRGKRHSLLEYTQAIAIVVGLVIFGLETDGVEQDWRVTQKGLWCLAFMLLFDSLTPHFQDAHFANYTVSTTQATFGMALFSTGGILIVMLVTGQLFQGISFLWEFHNAKLHLGVLSCASTLTQWMIMHTIQNFGPVIFTLIVTMRQLFSVVISAILFQHHLNPLAIISMVVVFGAVVGRALQPQEPTEVPEEEPAEDLDISGSIRRVSGYIAQEGLMQSASNAYKWLRDEYGHLVVCAMGIHVFHGFYSVAQEFLSAHTYEGRVFAFPLFLVAASHTTGAFLAVVALRIEGIPILTAASQKALMPAMTNLSSTWLQHAALYSLYFPAQTLLKTLKIIPVMLVGRVLKNRQYSRFDYLEGIILTVLVGVFVWDFQLKQSSGVTEASESTSNIAYHGSVIGVIMMLGYVALDPFTSNLEDHAYQTSSIVPAQMLFMMELASGLVAWVILLANGELIQAIDFLHDKPFAVLVLLMLSAAAAAGAFTCLITIRLFGPSVFTLIMMSRQIVSLLISVIIFQHSVSVMETFFILLIVILLLAGAVRRVVVQRQQDELEEVIIAAEGSKEPPSAAAEADAAVAAAQVRTVGAAPRRRPAWPPK